MRVTKYNRYTIGVYLLIGFAPLFILAALLMDPEGYLQSPFLMLSATCLIGGVFLFALGRGDFVDAQLASRFSMQGIPALDNTILVLGGNRAAIFLPPDSNEGSVMQFIPIQSNYRVSRGDEGVLIYHDGSVGTLHPPLAAPILDDLKRDNDLILPHEYSRLTGAIREVCEDLLSVVDRVEVRREGDTVTFDLHNYLFLPTCISRREASSTSCMLCPCSICSLIACMISEGLGCEVNLSQVVLDETARSPFMRVHYIFAKGAEVPD